MTDQLLPAAGLDRRFYAYALDRLVAWPLVALAAWLGWRLGGGSWVAGLVLALGTALVVGVGSGLLLGVQGSTPGKAVLGLRVVGVATGAPLGAGPAVLRTLVVAAAGLPTLGLGVAALAQTAVLDPGRRRRAWHDHLTGAVVVDVRPAGERADRPVEPALPRPVVNLTAMRLAVPAPTPDSLLERTQVRGTPAAGRHAAPATLPAERWRVVFDSGEQVLVDGVVLVGRRPEARRGVAVGHLVPLRSRDRSVSKTHAQLHLSRDGSLVVTDRGSTNGSALVRSGVARVLPPGRPTALLEGDVVHFGDRSMTVSRES